MEGFRPWTERLRPWTEASNPPGFTTQSLIGRLPYNRNRRFYSAQRRRAAGRDFIALWIRGLRIVERGGEKGHPEYPVNAAGDHFRSWRSLRVPDRSWGDSERPHCLVHHCLVLTAYKNIVTALTPVCRDVVARNSLPDAIAPRLETNGPGARAVESGPGAVESGAGAIETGHLTIVTGPGTIKSAPATCAAASATPESGHKTVESDAGAIASARTTHESEAVACVSDAATVGSAAVTGEKAPLQADAATVTVPPPNCHTPYNSLALVLR